MPVTDDLQYAGEVPGVVYHSWTLVRQWMKLVVERGIPYTIPNIVDAAAYTVTEAAEAVDAYLRLTRPGDTRANDRASDLREELADTFIMACHVLGKWPVNNPYTYGVNLPNGGVLDEAEKRLLQSSLALTAKSAGTMYYWAVVTRNEESDWQRPMIAKYAVQTLNEIFVAMRLSPTEPHNEHNPRLMVTNITDRLVYRTYKVTERGKGDMAAAQSVMRDITRPGEFSITVSTSQES